MKSHIIRGESSTSSKIERALDFFDKNPEYCMLLVNESRTGDNDTVMVSFDMDEQVDSGHFLFINLHVPGKVYSSESLRNGMERFVNNFRVEDLSIFFYGDPSALAHFLAF